MSTFRIIQKLGGRKSAFEKIKAQGFDRSLDALRMWHARGRIPSDAITFLMKAADGEGVPYTAADFELANEEAA